MKAAKLSLSLFESLPQFPTNFTFPPFHFSPSSSPTLLLLSHTFHSLSSEGTFFLLIFPFSNSHTFSISPLSFSSFCRTYTNGTVLFEQYSQAHLSGPWLLLQFLRKKKEEEEEEEEGEEEGEEETQLNFATTTAADVLSIPGCLIDKLNPSQFFR